MNFVNVLKRVDFKQLLQVVSIGIKRPHFVWPTLKATNDCMNIASQHYGRLHHKNGPANAFRHALWNYFIAKRCYKWQGNKQVVLTWAKNITDWHENALRNQQLPRAMDLHNNAVGRTVFEQEFETPESEVVEIIKRIAEKSIKMDADFDALKLKNELVHLTD